MMILKLVMIYLLVLTLATFIVCGIDKFAAKKQMRLTTCSTTEKAVLKLKSLTWAAAPAWQAT